MNILILGIGGQIGNAVAQKLIADLFNVTGVSRKHVAQPLRGVDYLQADRSDVATIEDILEQHNVDVVIDVVAYTLPESKALIERINRWGGRYVMLSSSDVYKNYGLFHGRESGEVVRDLIVETSPLRSSRFPYRGRDVRKLDDPSRWMDAYDKIPIEEWVQTMSIDWAILRLPMVFGPTDPQNRFDWIMRGMLAGDDKIMVPQAWLNWIATYDFIDNVAEAICLCATHQDDVCDIFNVASFQPVPHKIWAERFARICGWAGEIVVTRDGQHPLSVATQSLDLTVPFPISGDRFLTAFQFKPSVDVDEAIRRTIMAARP